MARFLHYFPQYSLADLRGGGLSYPDFVYLVGGMLDNEAPEVTEPIEDKVKRKVRELAMAAHDRAKRG